MLATPKAVGDLMPLHKPPGHPSTVWVAQHLGKIVGNEARPSSRDGNAPVGSRLPVSLVAPVDLDCAVPIVWLWM